MCSSFYMNLSLKIKTKSAIPCESVYSVSLIVIVTFKKGSISFLEENIIIIKKKQLRKLMQLKTKFPEVMQVAIDVVMQ